jgi:hypothetical protein
VAIFDLLSMQVKTGIASKHLRPSLALIDPTVSYSLPKNVVAASGFDVLDKCQELWHRGCAGNTQRDAYRRCHIVLLYGLCFASQSIFSLCQYRLCLREPEGHVHGAVQVNGGGEGSAGGLLLTCPGIPHAKAAVAVGLEGTHTKFLSQGEGL